MKLAQIFGWGVIKHLDNQRFKTFLKYILLSWIGLISFSVQVYPIRPGLDWSWVFALNYFAEKGIKFGKDLVWTYGPLGFLVVPMDVGSNIKIGIVFQLFVWAVLIATLICLVYKNYFSNLQLFCFLLFLSGGAWAWAWPRRWDYFICFLVLFFLSLSMGMGRKWYLFYIIAALFSTLLIFIKFSSALLALSAMVLFTFVSAIFDRNKFRTSEAISFIGIPVVFVLIYLLYNPSLIDLIYYLKYGYEIISGYSSGMSESGKTTQILWALFFILIYFFMAFKLYKWKEKSFFLSILFVVPLFVTFKHGFVRQPPHLITFFSFSLLMFGLILLFTDTKRLKDKKMISLMALLIISWHIVVGGHIRHFHKYFLEKISGISAVDNLEEITNLPKRMKRIEQYWTWRLSEGRLPEKFLRKIGRQRVSIFPWEIAYAAINGLNYTPLPTLQTYSAYTSYLDLTNANYLEDSLKAPKFILMSWDTVDQRHPLIDVPAMWLSLYKWYDVEEGNDSILLLKKRRDFKFSKLEFISKKEYSLFEIIKIPSSQHPVVVRISLDLNLLGKLSKIFFRIPEVYMAGMTDLGGIAFRVMPDVLRDGVLINYIPTNLKESGSLISNNMAKDILSNFKLYGDGIKYFKEKILVVFYEIPEVTIVQSKEEMVPPVSSAHSISLQSNYEIN